MPAGKHTLRKQSGGLREGEGGEALLQAILHRGGRLADESDGCIVQVLELLQRHFRLALEEALLKRKQRLRRFHAGSFAPEAQKGLCVVFEIGKALGLKVGQALLINLGGGAEGFDAFLGRAGLAAKGCLGGVDRVGHEFGGEFNGGLGLAGG